MKLQADDPDLVKWKAIHQLRKASNGLTLAAAERVIAWSATPTTTKHLAASYDRHNPEEPRGWLS